jgi:hypothetical protein
MPKLEEFVCQTCGQKRPTNQFIVVGRLTHVCTACDYIDDIDKILKTENARLAHSGDVNPKFLAALRSARDTLGNWDDDENY